MLRLRTTVVLSLLGLAIGIAGTYWLSVRSTNEPLAMPAVASVKGPTSWHRRPAPSMARTRAAGSMRSPPLPMQKSVEAVPRAVPAVLPPELVPLDMPASGDLAYDKLRGHLDGRVVVRVSVDGDGYVIAASVAVSSGDAVLDAHALRSVRGWRFAVPPDYPDGLSADLPMRFSSHDDPVASVP